MSDYDTNTHFPSICDKNCLFRLLSILYFDDSDPAGA